MKIKFNSHSMNFCIVFSLIIFTGFSMFSFPESFAVSVDWRFGTYNLNSGGVQGAGVPTDPIHLTVIDSDALGAGTIKVDITSSEDPRGIFLTLNEGPPGTFKNIDLTLMADNANANLKSLVTVSVFDNIFTTPDPFSIQELEGLPVLIVSDSDTTGISPKFVETGRDTNLYTAKFNFGKSTNSQSNELAATKGDVFTIIDLAGGNFANGFVGKNPNVGKGAILASIGGTVTASYKQESSSFAVGPDPGPGRGSGGIVRPGLVLDSLATGGNCNSCQPPTLGLDRKFERIVNEGFSYNDYSTNVETFYTPFPLITVTVGQKNTAILKVFDDGGVENIRHVGLGFGLGKGQSFSQSKATISLDKTFDQKEITSIYDPENVLDDVKITTSTSPCSTSSTASCLVVKIEHLFREQLEFNMVSTNVWDSKRNSWQNFYNHGIEITGDSLNPPRTKMVAFGEDKMRGLYELTQIDKISHTWSDEFGNIYENKGNDRFDRIYSVPGEIVYDKHSEHGCDRKCNWFEFYKLHQELLAGIVMKDLLAGKTIEGEPPEEPFSYNIHITSRADDLELQKNIILEQIRSEEILRDILNP